MQQGTSPVRRQVVALLPDAPLDERTVQVRNTKKVSQPAALQRFLQSTMLRRLKKEVLKDIPPRIEGVIEVELSAQERDVYRVFEENAQRKFKTFVRNGSLRRNHIKVL